MDPDVETGFSGDLEIGRERSELNNEKNFENLFLACIYLVNFRDVTLRQVP